LTNGCRRRGADNAEIFGRLGISEAEVKELRARGIL
jgi:hypothetical protein